MQGKANNILTLKSPTRKQIIEAQSLFKQAKRKKRSRESILNRVKFHKKKISEIENDVLSHGIEMLRKNNSVSLIGDPKNKASVLSFTLKGIHPHDIATILDDDGVAIRAGHHCCQILHEKIGIPATARASLGLYNSKEDIDILLNSIEKCKKVFKI